MTGAFHKNSAWFMPFRSDDAPIARLFCFPCAGFGAAMYRSWPQGLPRGVEVVGVQPPGRANRLGEPPLKSIPALVGGLLPHLRDRLDLPFAFFGHSMGAVFAAQTALALAEAGLPAPMHLFLSSRQPPDVPSPVGPLSHLSDDAFVAEMMNRYAAIPPEILAEPDLLALVLPATRADVAALEEIEGAERQALPAPVTAFGGSADALVPEASLDAWRRWSPEGFGLRMFDGGHFYLDPGRDALLAAISAELSERLAARAEAAE